jgi:predicted RNA-binding protein with PIN domain
MTQLQWLIDGHNLIGQLQDLELDDPHDEAKLTMAVKSYCMRGRCKATIIFDNGLPGGVSKQLSSYDVTVIFAPPRTQADNLLMRRAKEIGNGNMRDIILVTSDNRILRLARAYGMETMSSEEFALLLGFRPVEIDPEMQKALGKKTAIRVVYEKNPNPVVTQEEIAFWLPIFKRKLAMVRLAHAEGRVAERAARETRREEKRGASKRPAAARPQPAEQQGEAQTEKPVAITASKPAAPVNPISFDLETIFDKDREDDDQLADTRDNEAPARTRNNKPGKISRDDGQPRRPTPRPRSRR